MIMKERVVIKPVSVTKRGEIQYFQIRLPRDAKNIIGVETGICRTGKGFSEYVRSRVYGPAPVPAPALAAAAPVASYKVPVPVPAPRGSLFQSTLAFRRDILIGELKLQSLEKANVFFSDDVYERDQNMGFADFSTSGFMIPSPFTHEFNRFEEKVIVDGVTTLIGGYFKDRIGERFKTNLSYSVNVYVWYEIEEEKTEKEEQHDNRLCS
jgi:hypothetical protein